MLLPLLPPPAGGLSQFLQFGSGVYSSSELPMGSLICLQVCMVAATDAFDLGSYVAISGALLTKSPIFIYVGEHGGLHAVVAISGALMYEVSHTQALFI